MLHIFRRKRSHNDQDNDIMIIILQPAGVDGGRFCAAHILCKVAVCLLWKLVNNAGWTSKSEVLLLHHAQRLSYIQQIARR